MQKRTRYGWGIGWAFPANGVVPSSGRECLESGWPAGETAYDSRQARPFEMHSGVAVEEVLSHWTRGPLNLPMLCGPETQQDADSSQRNKRRHTSAFVRATTPLLLIHFVLHRLHGHTGVLLYRGHPSRSVTELPNRRERPRNEDNHKKTSSPSGCHHRPRTTHAPSKHPTLLLIPLFAVDVTLAILV